MIKERKDYEVLTISGGHTNYTDTYDGVFYMCEAVEAEKHGINLDKYKVIKSVAGLRDRASKVDDNNVFLERGRNNTVDGYELWITKKK